MINFLKENWIMLVILAVSLGTTIGVCTYARTLRQKIEMLEHNFDAAKDELSEEKLKNDALLYEKKAFILSREEMMKELDISKKELKELNGKLSAQAVYISKLESSIRIDTITTVRDSIIYVDNTPKEVIFNYSDKWLSLRGKTNIEKKTTGIYDVDVPVPLWVGFTEDYSVFAVSSNPYLKITAIDAVAIDEFVHKNKYKPYWNFGVYGGFGLQYGIITKALDVGPQVGIGVMYRF